MAECQLPKLNVAGSSPVSRSTLVRVQPSAVRFQLLKCPQVSKDFPMLGLGYKRGTVREDCMPSRNGRG